MKDSSLKSPILDPTIMSQATEAPPKFRTVAELLHKLGDIPAERVRLHP